MSFVISYLLSLVICYLLDIKGELNMHKYLADIGYKMKYKTQKKEENEPGVISINLDPILKLIPYVNLGYAIFKYTFLCNNKDKFVEAFKSSDMIEKMNKVELHEYKKHPSVITALTISKNKSIVPIGRIRHKEENGEISEIEFILKSVNGTKRIEIISISGPVSKLSFIEILMFIDKYMGDEPRIIDNHDGTIYYENVENIDESFETKLLSKLERYKQLRDSLKQNGYLYGEEMCEYKDLQEELDGPKLSLN